MTDTDVTDSDARNEALPEATQAEVEAAITALDDRDEIVVGS